jgi:sialidase-1
MKLHSTNRVSPMFFYFTAILFSIVCLTAASCKKITAISSADAAVSNGQLQTNSGLTTDTYTKIFTGNTEGYHSYRIPSIVRTATNKVLIAICEGRDSSNFDYGNINIVCKRSVDNGAHWLPIQAIAGPGNFTDGNPTAVVDPSTNFVWIVYLHSDRTHYTYLDAAGETHYKPFAPGDRRVMVIHSEDEGVNWIDPTDITSTTTPATIAQDYIGPGVGIYKAHSPNAGTMIIPAYGRNIYSTTHGSSWTFSPITNGTTQSTESTIVEKISGGLIRNDRATSTQDTFRRVATGSFADQFPTWISDTNLPDPKSEGSVMRYNETAPNRIMFLNSASKITRTAMQVKITYNEGATWPVFKSFTNHGTGKLGGYSSMVKTGDDNIGALIEYNENDGIKTKWHMSIEFHKFGLPWIVGNQIEP